MFNFIWCRFASAFVSFGFSFLVFLAGLSSTSTAQDSFWTNDTGDERWNSEGNWDPLIASQSRNAIFSEESNVLLDSYSPARSLVVRSDADIDLFNSQAGFLDVGSGALSRISGSAKFVNLTVWMGGGNLRVTGALSILNGTGWRSVGELFVFNDTDFGLVVVDGSGSTLNHETIRVGLDPIHIGGMLINNNGVVIARSFKVSSGSTVGINGGELNAGVFPLTVAPRIVGSSGTVTGSIFIDGDIDFSTSVDYFDDDLDWTGCVLNNSGQLTGATLVETSFNNGFGAEVDLPASPAMRFLGNVDNHGSIQQAENGILETDNFFTNEDNGLIVLRGQLNSGQPIFNRGTLLFDGANTSVFGDFVNGSGGVVQTNANKRVTFHDLFFNDGEPFETAINATTVLAGLVYGHGHYTGEGSLIIADEFIAGNDDIATIEIEPSTIVGSSAELKLEIEGASLSEFDQLMFANDVVLNGTVDVDLRGIYQTQQGAKFDLISAANIQLGSGFSVVPPFNHSVSHTIVDIGDGREALRIEFTEVPGYEVVSPESIQVTRGTFVSGTAAELAVSDNADLSFERSRQSALAIAQIVVGTAVTSPSPSELRLRIESSVFARGDVELKVEVFNFANDRYEVLATETANRFTDSTFEHTFPDDPEHYIDPNGEMEARITYSSSVNRRLFRANVDQIVWVVGD